MFSRALNDAVNSLTNLGIVVVVAAGILFNNILVSHVSGNEGRSACLTSPASARDVISVAATTRDSKLARFSNRGKYFILAR